MVFLTVLEDQRPASSHAFMKSSLLPPSAPSCFSLLRILAFFPLCRKGSWADVEGGRKVWARQRSSHDGLSLGTIFLPSGPKHQAQYAVKMKSSTHCISRITLFRKEALHFFMTRILAEDMLNPNYFDDLSMTIAVKLPD